MNYSTSITNIARNPDDWAPRLEYADALAQQSDGTHIVQAELIRLSYSILHGHWDCRECQARLVELSRQQINIPAADFTSSCGAKMVLLPPGSFMFGGAGSVDFAADELPPIPVTLTRGFWIGERPVTCRQWISVMGCMPQVYQPLTTQQTDRLAYTPVTCILYDEALQFCKKLTTMDRLAGYIRDNECYTLPTEVQWEYACRAGSAARYCFGDDFALLGEYAWYIDNSLRNGPNTPRPHVAGLRRPNQWGLYDMHGNVNEWCLPCSPAAYIRRLAAGVCDPAPSDYSSAVVARGGSWLHSALYLVSAGRHHFARIIRRNSVGFRIVLNRE